MRQVAGEPEQLELEGEAERVERRPGGRQASGLVQEVEEAGQRAEGPRIRLLLGEEPQHRLRPDEPDREPVGVLARRAVRPDQVDARHRLQLAAALVEEQLDVAERLEPRPEA